MAHAEPLSRFELLGFPEVVYDGPWLVDEDVTKLVGRKSYVNAYGACMRVAQAEAAGGHWRCCIYDHYDPGPPPPPPPPRTRRSLGLC